MHAQLIDVAALQKALYELERSHLRQKQQYVGPWAALTRTLRLTNLLHNTL